MTKYFLLAPSKPVVLDPRVCNTLHMTTAQKSFVDTRQVEECIAAVEQNFDYDSIRTLARATERLNLEIARTLTSCGSKCGDQGSQLKTLGERAVSIATLVPEKIIRRDSGADRSAHASISRSSQEIATSVNLSCT